MPSRLCRLNWKNWHALQVEVDAAADEAATVDREEGVEEEEAVRTERLAILA